MLAVKSERNEGESEMRGFSVEENEFVGGEDLLDAIDFDGFFAGFSDGDVLPDLEMDHEAVAELSSSESENKSGKSENAAPDSDVGLESPVKIPEKETVSTMAEPESVRNRASKEAERSGKKKKAKVGWTPELHRRFVTAVEQLGIDKAVPSRILEIMGVACLTRHNIASHLQKYRSQRKHLQAREAEAARWSRRRQIYGSATAPTQLNHWIAPAMGFPPVTPVSHYRPLHVWGHPSVDQSLMYTWPKHVAPPSHAWPPPLGDPSFWHPPHPYVPSMCFPSQFPHTTFPPAAAAGGDAPTAQTVPRTACDVHPSKESIDAAIGDVITKPWLPLPLGLKPPSMDSVILELQRQGVSKIPPT